MSGANTYEISNKSWYSLVCILLAPHGQFQNYWHPFLKKGRKINQFSVLRKCFEPSDDVRNPKSLPFTVNKRIRTTDIHMDVYSNINNSAFHTDSFSFSLQI